MREKKDSDVGMREKCNRKKDRCSSYVFVVSRLTNVFLFILHQISGINHILSALEVHVLCVCVCVWAFCVCRVSLML